MIFLQGHGVSAAFAARIYKRYGEQSIQLVRKNPYRLARDAQAVNAEATSAVSSDPR